jgi:hypothetical protein
MNEILLKDKSWGGGTYAAQHTIQPSEEDQHALHACKKESPVHQSARASNTSLDPHQEYCTVREKTEDTGFGPKFSRLSRLSQQKTALYL